MSLLSRQAVKASIKGIPEKKGVPPVQLQGLRKIYALGYLDGARHGQGFARQSDKAPLWMRLWVWVRGY